MQIPARSSTMAINRDAERKPIGKPDKERAIEAADGGKARHRASLKPVLQIGSTPANCVVRQVW